MYTPSTAANFRMVTNIANFCNMVRACLSSDVVTLVRLRLMTHGQIEVIGDSQGCQTC